MAATVEVKNLTMNFGGLCAIDQVSLEVQSKEIVSLIGPNGAGKTTFFNCITGIYNPTQGEIHISPPNNTRKKISGLKPNQVTSQGLARTFQNIRLFSKMSVLENVMVGLHCRTKSGILGAILGGKKTKKEEEYVVEKSYEFLELVGLTNHAEQFAGSLPYAFQRRLEIARAMATHPFLLLLDEPAAGMNPQETNDLDELILKIRDQFQVAILLIEHDMKLVMSISDRIYVMDYGKKIAQGVPESIQNDEKVIKAYLGEDFDA